MSDYLGHALNPAFQPIYEQATEDLSQYGKGEQSRYFCERLDRYVSDSEVQKTDALERVLLALEQGRDKAHVLELLNTNLPEFIDRSVHARYVTAIVRKQAA